MDIQYLLEFVVLADMCNYQEAAEALHVSQSALSKHIQKLEEELGEELFVRSARAVTLSKYGSVFLEYARQITVLREDALRHIQRMRAEDTARLVIIYPPALERYGLVELLVGFRRLHPEATVETIRSVDPVGALRARRCDVAFTQTDLKDAPDIVGEIYLRDDTVAVLPEHHPLASAPSISVEQLKDEKFILYKRAEESTMVPETTLLHLCAAAGFEPNIVMSASFSSTIVSLVSQGIGIAVMQRLQVPQNNDHVALVKLEPTVSTDIQLIFLKNSHLSSLQTAFIEYVSGTERERPQ